MSNATERDLGDEFRQYWELTSPHASISTEGAYEIYRACKYVARQRIPGCFVDFCARHGGLGMLAARVFLNYAYANRNIWLFSATGDQALPATELDQIQSSINLAGYPRNRIFYVDGDLFGILRNKGNTPDQIAVLRTDIECCYQRKDEFNALCDCVSIGGIILVNCDMTLEHLTKLLHGLSNKMPTQAYLTKVSSNGMTAVKISKHARNN